MRVVGHESPGLSPQVLPLAIGHRLTDLTDRVPLAIVVFGRSGLRQRQQLFLQAEFVTGLEPESGQFVAEKVEHRKSPRRKRDRFTDPRNVARGLKVQASFYSACIESVAESAVFSLSAAMKSSTTKVGF
jgi:hypothetical protein